MSSDRLWFAAMQNVDAHLYSAAPEGGRWRVVEHPLPPHAAIQLLSGEVTQRRRHGQGRKPAAAARDLALRRARWPRARSPPRRRSSMPRPTSPSSISPAAATAPWCLTTSCTARGFASTARRRPLVSAYGGFGVSWLPSYANHEFETDLGLPLLERGGVFVLANVRGGGEYGPAWHDAARRGQRQASLDDLAAVAHDLVRIGAVAPDRLGAGRRLQRRPAGDGDRRAEPRPVQGRDRGSPAHRHAALSEALHRLGLDQRIRRSRRPGGSGQAARLFAAAERARPAFPIRRCSW